MITPAATTSTIAPITTGMTHPGGPLDAWPGDASAVFEGAVEGVAEASARPAASISARVGLSRSPPSPISGF